MYVTQSKNGIMTNDSKKITGVLAKIIVFDDEYLLAILVHVMTSFIRHVKLKNS